MRAHLLVAAALAACGAPSPSSPAAPGAAELTLETRVPAASEVHRCAFARLPADAAFLVGADHDYTPGSHHFLVFRTELDDVPAGSSGVVDCFEGGGVMTYARGVVYGSQEATGRMALPPSVGVPLRPREVLLLQAHYLNTREQPLDARVRVRLRTAPAGSVAVNAGVLFFYNPFIHVPAGATAKAAMRCRLPADVTLLSAVSHYHKRGVSYAAYLDDPSGALAATPFYTSADWEHPRPRTEPLAAAAGARIRFECPYDNRAGARDYFQGPSAEDDEMCMFTGLYFPAQGRDVEVCRTDPDRIGVGTRTCAQTLDCVRACPPGSAPQLGDGQPRVSECWQRCMTAACPTATAPLLAQLACLRRECALPCASGGSACTECALVRCSSEVGACQSAACGP